jgi:hypothetical protein
VLKDAAGNSYAAGYEDQAAEQFASPAGLGAKPVIEMHSGP